MTRTPAAEEPHWTEPGAYEVAPGVHRIPLPLPMDGLRAVNVYAIETEQGLTLVDGGWAIEESRKQLDAGLAAIGYDARDITRFLVTHAHRDHYTLAAAVRAEFGSRVTLGAGERATLDVLHAPGEYHDDTVVQLRRAGAHRLAEQWVSMTAEERVDTSNWGYPDEWLDGDVTLDLPGRELAAVSTPGHTSGHYVFADLGEGVLFAGDHVLPTITPSIGFEASYTEQPLRAFLASLAKVRAMPDMRLLPAHGPVTDSSHRRIDELVAHHDTRLDLSLQAVLAGSETAHEVAGELPWTRHRRRLHDLDPFNATLATLETAWHLNLLVARERLQRETVDGVWRYRSLPSA